MIMQTGPVLIGRDAVLAQATQAVRGGGGLGVTGEAGAGKTALLSAALAASGRRVLSGQCFRSLAWTAGLALQQALGRLLPVGDPAWTAQWVVQSTGSSVLCLDDLQWADPMTLAVVALLPAAMSFVATVRLGDPGTEAALAAVHAAGATVLEVPALSRQHAIELALAAHPRLRRAEAEALAARCGSNPLLIQELGADPSPSIGLRRSVTGRLRRLGPEAWRGFALLALADEPLPRAWLPESAGLVDSGFAVVQDERVQPRHPLLAEVVRAELAEARAGEHSEVALDLALRAERGGHLALAARSFAAAGDAGHALRLALLAVEGTTRPGERAGLLHLAASSAVEPQASELATRAVSELVSAGDYVRAAGLLEQLPDVQSAQWCGLVGRVHWQLGNDVAALAAFEAGLALAEAGTRDLVLLQAEYARAVLLGLGQAERGLELARAAHASATDLGVEQARALAVLGTAEHFLGRPDDAVHLEQAVELAVRDGDLMVEFTSANNLVAVHESAGRGREALALAQRFATRAADLHLREWQHQMQAMALNAQMHLGDYDAVVSGVPPLLNGVVDRRTRDQLEVTLALALVDLGRYEAAFAQVAAALETCVDHWVGRGNLLWVRAEAQLWSGNPQAALADALASLEHTPPDANQLFALITAAHARVRLGEPVGPELPSMPHVPLLDGAPLEIAALAAQSAGNAAAAAESFAAAATAWAGFHQRGELRCRWLAADLDADPDQARTALLALEQELSDAGLTPLLGRVRRSLRARGVRSAAPRGRAGALTAREREVLDLVAEGLSTEAVAARLGLSPSTVAAQIASARARLGASTRWQASSG
jgi:DNA-binding CsgD family transcriptional regulator/tetratricopeptide (TPR) repeat protein